MKLKITDYSLQEFLNLTVEITYRQHERLYSLSVPNGDRKVRAKTLTHDEKVNLYSKLASKS